METSKHQAAHPKLQSPAMAEFQLSWFSGQARNESYPNSFIFTQNTHILTCKPLQAHQVVQCIIYRKHPALELWQKQHHLFPVWFSWTVTWYFPWFIGEQETMTSVGKQKWLHGSHNKSLKLFNPERGSAENAFKRRFCSFSRVL